MGGGLAAFAEALGELDVFEGVEVVGFLHGFHRLDDLGGGAEHKAVRGDDGTLGDQRIGTDDGAMADDGTVEDSGTHTDEAFIFDGAGVQADAVTDGHVVTEVAAVVIGHVHAGVILEVGALADADGVDITAQGGVVPDGGVFCSGYLTDEIGASCDKSGGVYRGSCPVKFFDGHAAIIAVGRCFVNGKSLVQDTLHCNVRRRKVRALQYHNCLAAIMCGNRVSGTAVFTLCACNGDKCDLRSGRGESPKTADGCKAVWTGAKRRAPKGCGTVRRCRINLAGGVMLGLLRGLLLSSGEGKLGDWLCQLCRGRLPTGWDVVPDPSGALPCTHKGLSSLDPFV